MSGAHNNSQWLHKWTRLKRTIKGTFFRGEIAVLYSESHPSRKACPKHFQLLKKPEMVCEQRDREKKQTHKISKANFRLVFQLGVI